MQTPGLDVVLGGVVVKDGAGVRAPHAQICRRSRGRKFPQTTIAISRCFHSAGPTSDGLLVVLDGTPPLHLHHAPLDAAVADVTEVLGVPLDAVGHRVGGGGGEAALVLLKVLVVPDLTA